MTIKNLLGGLPSLEKQLGWGIRRHKPLPGQRQFDFEPAVSANEPTGGSVSSPQFRDGLPRGEGPMAAEAR